MINFYIKSITAFGKGKTTSTIDFIDGINIIKGDSDTGKTKVITSILFAMGASHKPFAQKTGYDEVKLVVGTPAGDISFTRKYNANLIEVISDNAEIEDGTYTTQYNTDRTPINDVWLKLMGIEELPMLASNKRSVKKRMTWNNLMRLFYIDELEICREESIIEPVQYTEKTLLLSAILYLAYGKNFASDKIQKDSAVRKAKNEIMEEYLNKRLSMADSQLVRLKAYADAIYDSQLRTELQKTAESQKEIENQISEALENSQSVAQKIMAVEQKISEMDMLADRYDSLQTQYQSDLRRLSFITEGEALIAGKKPVKLCPYCDNEIQLKKLPSFRSVSEAEKRRIRQHIVGLTETQKSVAADKADLEKQLLGLKEEYDRINAFIQNDLVPRRTEIEKLIAGYQEEIDNRSQYKVYQQMRAEIIMDLKEYITDDSDEPEDYRPKEYFDADFCESMNGYAMQILENTCYPNLVAAYFDLKTFDLVINGGTKVDDHGKGYSAFINTVVALMFRKYLVERGTFTPGITIIDSPLHGMFQGVEDDAPESMKTGLFRYFCGLSEEGQLIVAENDEHVPELDYANRNVHVIEFSKNDPSKRHGFLLDVYQ
ncbi:MAG: hypothetical protein J6M24_03505 [Lachnospiraceae bacterium]|nr:hypothetical protein [Lachnospiraceae bacterium]